MPVERRTENDLKAPRALKSSPPAAADTLDAGEFAHPFYNLSNKLQRLGAPAMKLGIAVDRRQIDSLVGVQEHTREHRKFIAPLHVERRTADVRTVRCSAIAALPCSRGASRQQSALTGA